VRVAVLGLGLVGGSVAQALPSHQVLGWDPSVDARDEAGAWGLPVTGSAADAVEPADLVVLAGPVTANDDLLAEVLAQRPDVLVTDVGSVKVPLVQRWQALGSRGRLVPGHPMAGSEGAGWGAADPAMLVGARWALCPGPWCTQADWRAVAEVVLSTGAVVVPAHPVAHDEAVALASHAPHVLAAVLGATAGGSPLALALGAGSFRDLTRVSAAPPERTTEFLFANRSPLAEALHRFADELRAVAEELEELDRSALARLLADGHAARAAWEAGRSPVHAQPVPLGDEGWAEELHALAAAGGVVTALQGSLMTVAVPAVASAEPEPGGARGG
jgi:prephenate dehydrogenase